jgi:hypothetical protein
MRLARRYSGPPATAPELGNSDIDRAERFYDRVMRLLAFKGTRPIAGEKRLHYSNPVTQYSIRPARVHSAASTAAELRHQPDTLSKR